MAQTLLYWRVGRRIHADVLGAQHAAYGEEIVATLSRQLSWSHFRELLPLKRPSQREFYAEMCRIEGWSVAADMIIYLHYRRARCLARRRGRDGRP